MAIATSTAIMIGLTAASVSASVIGGVGEYNAAKSTARSAKAQQQMNQETTKANKEKLATSRQAELTLQAKQQRIETGQIVAEQAGTGISGEFGTPFDQMVANETAQLVDTNNLIGKYDDAMLNEHIALNDSNFALDQQIYKQKQRKQTAIWSTAAEVTKTIASGYMGATMNQAKNPGVDPKDLTSLSSAMAGV